MKDQAHDAEQEAAHAALRSAIAALYDVGETSYSVVELAREYAADETTIRNNRVAAATFGSEARS